MLAEETVEKILDGFKKAYEGLDAEALENWISSVEDTESGGALAAITFYGACIRECMSNDIDSPFQSHLVATFVIRKIAEENLQDIFNYMVGASLPPRVGELIEYWKTEVRPQLINALKTEDGKPNFQFNFEVVKDYDDDDSVDQDLDDEWEDAD